MACCGLLYSQRVNYSCKFWSLPSHQVLGQALLRRLMDSCEKRKRERALITGGNTLGLPETQFKFEEPNIEMCEQQRKIDPCNYSIPLPLIHAETATIFCFATELPMASAHNQKAWW